MTEEKWQELVGRVKDDFGVEEERHGEDPETHTKTFTIIFTAPAGRMKLERLLQPRVTGERAIGGSKYGAGTSIQRTYSTEEFIDSLHAYRWDPSAGEWIPVNASTLTG